MAEFLTQFLLNGVIQAGKCWKIKTKKYGYQIKGQDKIIKTIYASNCLIFIINFNLAWSQSEDLSKCVPLPPTNHEHLKCEKYD